MTDRLQGIRTAFLIQLTATLVMWGLDAWGGARIPWQVVILPALVPVLLWSAMMLLAGALTVLALAIKWTREGRK